MRGGEHRRRRRRGRRAAPRRAQRCREPAAGSDRLVTTSRRRNDMSKVICNHAISIDGFSAGPNQTREKPFGDGPVDELTRWMFDEREKHRDVIDGITDVGANIMGRHMFGPDRGEWDLDWK